MFLYGICEYNYTTIIPHILKNLRQYMLLRITPEPSVKLSQVHGHNINLTGTKDKQSKLLTLSKARQQQIFKYSLQHRSIGNYLKSV